MAFYCSSKKFSPLVGSSAPSGSFSCISFVIFPCMFDLIVSLGINVFFFITKACACVPSV